MKQIKKESIAKLLNCIGILFLMAVIVFMIPFTIPNLFGMKIYAVLSESMTPSYPKDGVVYVKEIDAAEIQMGDVITYHIGTETECVMTHRVIDIESSYFITKGDANNTADPEPVSFDRLIGKVVYFLPKLAEVFAFINSSIGQVLLCFIFACSFLCWILAYRIAPVKTKRKKNIPWIRVIGVIAIIGSLLYLGSVFWDYETSALEYETIKEEIFVGIEENNLVFENTQETVTDEEVELLAKIENLHTEYEDVIGWIRFDHLDISYPILQGADNNDYLRRTFSGAYSSGGSIFLEAKNTSDFQDSHTIIYGHNMNNGSMFGSLKKYKTEENFYVGNEYITIYTWEKIYRYQIFSYYDIAEDGDVYQIDFISEKNFQELLDNMCRRSYYDTQITPNDKDKILTLSTCASKGKRFVVHAKRIGEKTR